MRKQERLTLFEAIQFTLMGLLFAWLAFTAGRAGSYLGAVFLSLLAGFTFWVLTDLRYGLRPSTHYEQFENRYFSRAILIFVGGGIILGVVVYTKLSILAPFSILFLFGWLGISIYAMFKVRGRGESIAAYKQRMNYVEPSQKND